MPFYRILRTPLYVEQFESYDSFHQKRITRFIHQLSWKGSQVGKPLGYVFFREKKFNGNRMYFLIYEEWKSVLLVMFSDKKKQPESIAFIKKEFTSLRDFAFTELKKDGLI